MEGKLGNTPVVIAASAPPQSAMSASPDRMRRAASPMAWTPAAQAVTDAGKVGQINVTGLGLPSEMAGAVESGATTSFAIWNPIDLGYAATMLAYNIANGAKAEPGASIPMGRMGAATLDDNNEAAMSDPFTYDKSNIEEFKSIF